MVVGLVRDVADDAEDQCKPHVEQVLALGERRDNGHQHDDRHQVARPDQHDAGHVTRERQDGEDHEDVRHRHRNEHAVGDFRIGGEEPRPHHHAVVLQHDHHDGRGAAAGHAKRHHRHERARGDAVVRRFGRDHALGNAGAVQLGVLGPHPRLLVGDERGDARPGARDDADDQADEGCPHDVPPACGRHAQPVDSVGPVRLRRASLTRLAHDHLGLDHHQRFRDREQSDQRRHQRHAVVELEETECRARRVVDVVGADHPDQQAEEPGDQALQQVLRRDHRDQGQAEQHHHHHFHRPEVQPDLGQPREQAYGHDGADQPAEHRSGEAQHQRLLRLALLCHGIAVDGRRGSAAGAGDLDQDRRYATREMGRAVQRDHERKCGVYGHCQRQRQQHDQRVLCIEPRQRADDDTQQYPWHDHPPQAELGGKLAKHEVPGQDWRSLEQVGKQNLHRPAREFRIEDDDEDDVGKSRHAQGCPEQVRALAHAHQVKRGDHR